MFSPLFLRPGMISNNKSLGSQQCASALYPGINPKIKRNLLPQAVALPKQGQEAVHVARQTEEAGLPITAEEARKVNASCERIGICYCPTSVARPPVVVSWRGGGLRAASKTAYSCSALDCRQVDMNVWG